MLVLAEVTPLRVIHLNLYHINKIQYSLGNLKLRVCVHMKEQNCIYTNSVVCQGMLECLNLLLTRTFSIIIKVSVVLFV